MPNGCPQTVLQANTNPEQLSLPCEWIVAEEIRVGTGSDRTLAAEIVPYRRGIRGAGWCSAGLEEYRFHLAREKPHSLFFVRTFVWAHRLAVRPLFERSSSFLVVRVLQ
jgi:hypothetical protein